MQAIAALGLRQQGADSFRSAPEKTGQHRQRRMGGAQLAGGHLQQGDLAAVGVEEHKALKAGGRQLGADRHHLGDQQLSRQAAGAGESSVFGRETEPGHRQPPDRQVVRQAGKNGIGDPVGEQGIGTQRQMGAVLLNRAERPEHGAAGTARRRAHLRPAEPFQRSLHQPPLLSALILTVGNCLLPWTMAGSGNQQPRQSQEGSRRPVPPTPPRQPAGAPVRKPPQVLHISRKDDEPVADTSAPIGADAPTPLAAPVAVRPVPQARETTASSDEDRFETASLEGLTMADLLGPAPETGRKAARNTPAAAAAAPGQAAVPARQVDDFDFDEEAFLAALEENEPVGVSGEVVPGVVIGVESDGVYVDIGGKAPGFMPKSECGLGVITNIKERFPKGLAVEVLVTREQNADGMVTISARALALRQSWEKVRKMEKEGKVVQVKVTGFNRGGVTCDLEGLRAFIPRSQLQDGENHEQLVGKTLGAAFLEVSADNRKLVLSEKRAATAARFSEIEVGQLVEGQVVAVKPYGLFVDLGGVSGLLHQSCITGGALRELREVFDQGDRVQAIVTSVDPGRGRIALNTALLENQPGELLINKEQVLLQAGERANRARLTLRQQEQAPE